MRPILARPIQGGQATSDTTTALVGKCCFILICLTEEVAYTQGRGNKEAYMLASLAKIIFTLLLIAHGLIHLLGFVKWQSTIIYNPTWYASSPCLDAVACLNVTWRKIVLPSGTRFSAPCMVSASQGL